jgi:hypothetical protein
MPNYVLAYLGGSMAEDPAEQERVMSLWMSWFGELGSAVVDAGSPFGPSANVGGSGGAAGAGLSGYSIISADNLDDACAKAKGCPVIESGGTVDVYESLPIG